MTVSTMKREAARLYELLAEAEAGLSTFYGYFSKSLLIPFMQCCLPQFSIMSSSFSLLRFNIRSGGARFRYKLDLVFGPFGGNSLVSALPLVHAGKVNLVPVF